MISASASFTSACTARCISSVVSTRCVARPEGSASSVGPVTRITWAPRLDAASASAYPMRPLDGFVSTRTGSRCSRVGPAVTTTRLPDHLLVGLPWCAGPRRRSAATRIVSGSLIRPGRSLGPSARAPISGPTKCQPRSVRVLMFADVAGRGRRTASGFLLAPPPHQAVPEAAAHELVERARRKLLFPIDGTVAREIVHVAREFRRYEHAEILVLRLSSDFCRCDNAHCSAFLLVQLIIKTLGLGLQASPVVRDPLEVLLFPGPASRIVRDAHDLGDRHVEIVIANPAIEQGRLLQFVFGALQTPANLFDRFALALMQPLQQYPRVSRQNEDRD